MDNSFIQAGHTDAYGASTQSQTNYTDKNQKKSVTEQAATAQGYQVDD